MPRRKLTHMQVTIHNPLLLPNGRPGCLNFAAYCSLADAMGLSKASMVDEDDLE